MQIKPEFVPSNNLLQDLDANHTFYAPLQLKHDLRTESGFPEKIALMKSCLFSGNCVSLIKSNQQIYVFLYLCALTLIFCGCGPRLSAGEMSAQIGKAEVLVDFPALYIDIDHDGQTSIGGRPIDEIGTLLGYDFSGFAVEQQAVKQLVAANIQHIQFENTATGIALLVNGNPLPGIGWDGQILASTAEGLNSFGLGMALLDKILPLVQNMGVGVVFRLPIASGQEVVPLVVDQNEAKTTALAIQREFLTTVGTQPTIQLIVTYANDGTWSVGSLTQAEWRKLTAIPWQLLNLPVGLVEQISTSSIRYMDLSTSPQGLHIAINGKQFPYIDWADGRINHAVLLATQLGLWQDLLGNEADADIVRQTLLNLLPLVQVSDIDIQVRFP